MKDLNKIKHGHHIVDTMDHGGLFFVEDIRRATGLEEKHLIRSLQQLLKHGYVQKNDRGQWSVPEELEE